jgi:hypothetical protein
MDCVLDRALIARLDIEHYKQVLAADTDEIRRELALRLLAEEEAILAQIGRDAAQPRADVA